MTVSEFSVAYERVLSRPFDPVDYGLCELSDLLEGVSENTVVIKQCGDDIVIAIPKREQTNQEILNTKQFAVEVFIEYDLLRFVIYLQYFKGCRSLTTRSTIWYVVQ